MDKKLRIEKFENLVGEVLTSIENNDSKELIFTLDTGEKYILYILY